MVQTLNAQKKAFQNEASYKFEEEEKVEDTWKPQENAEFKKILDDQINAFQSGNTEAVEAFEADLAGKVSRMIKDKNADLKQLDLVKQISNSGDNTFLNKYTGASSVVSHCKHYSHVSCLKNYRLQQELEEESQYQKQLSGFSFGEFACPICKSICNGILPNVSLLNVKDQSNEMLNFFVDALSEVVKATRGLVIGEKKPRELLLSDIAKDPMDFARLASNHFAHVVSLTDIKGLAYFNEVIPQESVLLGSVVQLVRLQQHDDQELIDQIEDRIEAIINLEMVPNVLANNVTLTLIKTLMLSCVIPGRDLNEQIELVLEVFLPILEQQFYNVVLWRKNQGRRNPKETVNQVKVDIEDDEYLHNIYIEAKLPVMRKVFAAVYLIREALGNQSGDIAKIIEQTSDQEELSLIVSYLTPNQAEDVEMTSHAPVEGDPNSQTIGETALLYEFSGEKPDQLKKIKQILAPFRSPKYLEEQQQALDDQRASTIPVNLALMTPYF